MHLSWVKTCCRHHLVQGQKAADAQNQGNFEYVDGNCSQLQLCHLQDETGNNFTMSQMFFTPTTDDDGKHVTCRAENPNVTGAYLEDTWRIEVVCK
jgi:hypothetical protein